MRKKLFIANWKMHKTLLETQKTLKELKEILGSHESSSVGVAPTYTSLGTAKEILKDSSISLCAQNVHSEDKGAFTGEISAAMLKDFSVKYCIVGHSERRHIFKETDAFIAKKVAKLVANSITPVLCIGETKDQRDKGKTLEVLKSQLSGSLDGVDLPSDKNLVIAYEPVWAIGTGDTATPDMAEEAQAYVRKTYGAIHGQDRADKTLILYGGSVKPDNAKALMGMENIDGALVGGAGLEAKSFSEIIKYL